MLELGLMVDVGVWMKVLLPVIYFVALAFTALIWYRMHNDVLQSLHCNCGFLTTYGETLKPVFWKKKLCFQIVYFYLFILFFLLSSVCAFVFVFSYSILGYFCMAFVAEHIFCGLVLSKRFLLCVFST